MNISSISEIGVQILKGAASIKKWAGVSMRRRFMVLAALVITIDVAQIALPTWVTTQVSRETRDKVAAATSLARANTFQTTIEWLDLCMAHQADSPTRRAFYCEQAVSLFRRLPYAQLEMDWIEELISKTAYDAMKVETARQSRIPASLDVWKGPDSIAMQIQSRLADAWASPALALFWGIVIGAAAWWIFSSPPTSQESRSKRIRLARLDRMKIAVRHVR